MKASLTMFSRLRQSTLLRALAVLASGTTLAQLLTLLTAPLLTRLYTPSELGMWSTYTAILLTIVTIASLRIDLAIVIAKTPTEARALFWLATGINVAFSTVVTLVMLIVSEPVSEALDATPLRFWLVTIGPGIFLYTQAQVFYNWFTRRRAFGAIIEQRVAQSLGINTTQVAGGLVAPSVSMLVLGTLFGGLLSVLASERRRKQEESDAPTTERYTGSDLMRRHWRMPVLNGIAAIADAVRLNGTNLLVAYFFSQHMLGFYSLAWRSVRMPVSLISGAMATVFYERFAACAPGTLVRQVRKCALICGTIGIPIFTGLALFGPAAFDLVFGSEWRLAGEVAQAMTPYLYLTFITSPISTVYLVTNRQLVSTSFALTYLVVPVVVIGGFHEDILEMTRLFSWSMSGLLALFLLAAFKAAKGHDARRLAEAS